MLKKFILFSALGILILNSCEKETEPIKELEKLLPEISTSAVDSITYTSAVTGGNVISDGNSKIINRGVCWGIIQNPNINFNFISNDTGVGIFTSKLTELKPNTNYFVRAYAVNSEGTSYGNQVSFKTNAYKVPTLSLSEISEIGQISANSGGKINSNGGLDLLSCGVCWSMQENPTINDSITSDTLIKSSFKSNITDLQPNTTYYIRAYATNDFGTGYSETTSFKTLQRNIIYGDGVTDIQGNYYTTVIINGQEWMAENMKTTKYNDGTEIPLVESKETWKNLNTPAYCWYDNDSVLYANTYGALYNWYTVNTGKICPEGWHIPSKDEWTSLIDYLEGFSAASGKLKESSTTHWKYPNKSASDLYGFKMLPSGNRNAYGNFSGLTEHGTLWSTYTLNSYTFGYSFFNDSGELFETLYWRRIGFSVRCLKD